MDLIRVFLVVLALAPPIMDGCKKACGPEFKDLY